jgi:hypothetical protein
MVEQKHTANNNKTPSTHCILHRLTRRTAQEAGLTIHRILPQHRDRDRSKKQSEAKRSETCVNRMHCSCLSTALTLRATQDRIDASYLNCLTGKSNGLIWYGW